MSAQAQFGTVLLLAVTAIVAPAGSGKAQITAVSGSGQMIRPQSSVTTADDIALRVHTDVELFVPASSASASASPAERTSPQSGPPLSGDLFETPASVACVYRLVPVASGCNPNVVNTNPKGGSNAIAIVDAYDTSHAASDLNTFISQFGLPAANFQVIYASTGSCATGGTAPPAGSGTGWDLETVLDIEWAHAMAPSAKLFLVEANSNSTSDMFAAEAVATKCVQANNAGEVSNSWGMAEFLGESAYDSTFTGANVVYLFSAGDQPGVEYPAASPNVVGVGGTTFSRGGSLPGTTGEFQGELPWNDDRAGLGTGGGPSEFETRPAYQNGISGIVDANRGTPDLGGIADPATGVWVYSTSYCGGWCIVGGTSVATPILAGIFNASGFFPSSSFAALTEIYTHRYYRSHVTDIDTGACGTADIYNPRHIKSVTHLSWNWCAGWGTEHGQY
jgi:kumamolisin